MKWFFSVVSKWAYNMVNKCKRVDYTHAELHELLQRKLSLQKEIHIILLSSRKHIQIALMQYIDKTLQAVRDVGNIIFNYNSLIILDT